MRTTIAALALVAAASAQDLDFSVVNAAPIVVTTAAPLVSGTATSTSIAVNTNTATAVAAAAVSASPLTQKRGVEDRDVSDVLFKRTDDACSIEPAGTGPSASNPDTAAGFLAYQAFADAANGAKTTSGWVKTFTNLQTTVQTSSFLGVNTLTSYDVAGCAAYCTATTGCIAFNVFFERDPTLNPATNCPNPASLTNIRCSMWGVPISIDTATNTGQWRNDFNVVQAGSNGYNVAPAIPAPTCGGYQPPTSYPGALNCGNDPTSGKNTFIGSKFFSFGTKAGQIPAYDPTVCTAACNAVNTYNSASRSRFGRYSQPTLCNQVVSSLLSKNGVPYGMYCAMYTESWDAPHATNTGTTFGGSSWKVDKCFSYISTAYSKNYSPICSAGSCSRNSYKGGCCGGYGRGAC